MLARTPFGLTAALGLTLMLLACHSAGPYGFSKTYTPLSEEADASENAQAFDPVMSERFAQEWRSKPVSVFGVVKSRNESGGTAYLTLSVRTLAPRNLCEEGGEQTCRVTVSDREHAIIHARVPLRKSDAIGPDSVGVGSLVRVIGKLTQAVDESDGNPVVQATYYRHWPQHYYVTTAARSYMTR